MHSHVVDSSRDGYLTAKQAASGMRSEDDVSVYMCGPPAKMTALSKGFQQLGIPASRIR